MFTHVPNKACAEHIAQTLVTEKLAACVNISSPVTSIYQWQGKVERAEEVCLTIKTSCKGYAACETKLRMLHPYELPEIVGIHVNEGLREYLAWVTAETLLRE